MSVLSVHAGAERKRAGAKSKQESVQSKGAGTLIAKGHKKRKVCCEKSTGRHEKQEGRHDK